MSITTDSITPTNDLRVMESDLAGIAGGLAAEPEPLNGTAAEQVIGIVE